MIFCEALRCVIKGIHVAMAFSFHGDKKRSLPESISNYYGHLKTSHLKSTVHIICLTDAAI